MVEFALIALGFFGLLLAIIDFSFAMFDTNTTNFGTRATARLTATTSSAAAATWDNTCPVVNLTASSGDPDLLRRLVCETKRRVRLGNERVRVRVRFEARNTPASPGQPKPGDSVVICAMTKARSLSGFYSSLLDRTVLTSKGRARIEGSAIVDVPNFASGQEDPFPGKSWSFCDPPALAGWSEAVPLVNYTCTYEANAIAESDKKLQLKITNASLTKWQGWTIDLVFPTTATVDITPLNVGFGTIALPSATSVSITKFSDDAAFELDAGMTETINHLEFNSTIVAPTSVSVSGTACTPT